RLSRGAAAAQGVPEDARRAPGVRARERRPQESYGKSEEVRDFSEYLRFVVTLTAVLDPFLAIPIFLAVTSSGEPAARLRLAWVVTLTVFLVLCGAAVFGEGLLRVIGASVSAFQVG